MNLLFSLFSGDGLGKMGPLLAFKIKSILSVCFLSRRLLLI